MTRRDVLGWDVFPAARGTDAIVQPTGRGPDGPTGGFFNREGAVPW